MPTDLETHPGPVEFDPFSDEYFNDPTATYARLRDEAPVYFNEHYGFYALSRFDDVASASLDWGTYSSEYGIDLATLRRRKHLGMDMIIMMDPPKHDRMRALVSRVFTPRAIGALEPMIREVITGYADQVDADRGIRRRRGLLGPVPGRDHLADAGGARG